MTNGVRQRDLFRNRLGRVFFCFALAFLSIFIFSPAWAADNDVQLSARVDRAQVAPGEVIQFRIVLRYPDRLKLELPEVGHEIESLRVVRDEVSPVQKMGSLVTKSRAYGLTTDQEGSYVLPNVVLVYRDGNEEKTLRTAKIYVEVKRPTAKDDSQDEAQSEEALRDIKPLYEKSFPWALVAGFAFLLLAAYGFYRWWVRWRKKRVSITDLPPLPYDEVALRDLEHLKSAFRNLKVDQVVERKRCYFRLSEILRSYIEHRYAFPASEWTTEEILPHLKMLRELIVADHERLVRVLQATDLVKFTDLKPEDSEPLRLWSETYEFVMSTRPKRQEPSLDPQVASMPPLKKVGRG